MELGMMVFGIVYDDNYASTASRTCFAEGVSETHETTGVKLFLLSLENQFSHPWEDHHG